MTHSDQRYRFAYIGNFGPEHSTENHVRQAIEHVGYEVDTFQENDAMAWENLILHVAGYDLVLWTSTGSFAEHVGRKIQWRMLAAARKYGVRTVGFHLDRWWGLDREDQVWERPFFRCDVVITADGGHQAEFASVGVNHFWLPPAVSLAETELGRRRNGMDTELAFVGSWQPGYHKEWTHRPELINWLSRKYRNRIKMWPQPGQPPVRGQDLRDLYASAHVIIGDSCLVGGATHYWSDRIPETVGRGGFLIHPYVEGIEEHFTPGEHLLTWPIGEWSTLQLTIDRALADGDMRKRVAAAGRAHVIENHTYDVRVTQILELAGLS